MRASRVRAWAAKTSRMRPGRSSTRTPSQRFSRLRVCAGVSSSSKTTSFARSSAATAPISSTAPFPTNVAGSGAARSFTNRATSTPPAVSSSRSSSSRCSSATARGTPRDGDPDENGLLAAPEPSSRQSWQNPDVDLSPRERLLGERLEGLYRTYGPETASSDPDRPPRAVPRARRPRGGRLDRGGVRLRSGRDHPRERLEAPRGARAAAGARARRDPRLPRLRAGASRETSATASTARRTPRRSSTPSRASARKAGSVRAFFEARFRARGRRLPARWCRG